MNDMDGMKTKECNKRAIVAGGAGFVGCHLCRRLLAEGYAVVTCVDNFQTGNLDNIARFRSEGRFRLVEHDIVEPFTVEGRVDEIYNLACPASPVHYQRNPVHTFKTSVIGSLNLLELAREKGARILLASTSEVYGDPHVPVQGESYWGNVNSYGLRSCYDEGKR